MSFDLNWFALCIWFEKGLRFNLGGSTTKTYSRIVIFYWLFPIETEDLVTVDAVETATCHWNSLEVESLKLYKMNRSDNCTMDFLVISFQILQPHEAPWNTPSTMELWQKIILPDFNRLCYSVNSTDSLDSDDQDDHKHP